MNSLLDFSEKTTTHLDIKKVNRKIQEEPQAEAAANPDTGRKRKSDIY